MWAARPNMPCASRPIPSALAARSIGFDALQTAVVTANVNQATGALNGDTQSQIIHTDGQLNNAQEFSRQIFTYRNGAPVRIGDVATVIDGLQNPNNRSWYKGKSAIVIYILRQPGSNTVETIQRDPGGAAPVPGQPAAQRASGNRL